MHDKPEISTIVEKYAVKGSIADSERWNEDLRGILEIYILVKKGFLHSTKYTGIINIIQYFLYYFLVFSTKSIFRDN